MYTVGVHLRVLPPMDCQYRMIFFETSEIDGECNEAIRELRLRVATVLAAILFPELG
jgi:hypothetical protein